MDKTVVLIHTVRSVVADLTRQAQAATGCRVLNQLDESLVQYRDGTAEDVTRFRRARLLAQARMAQDAGADVIAVTCSSMTPFLPELRGKLPVPVVSVDEKAVEETVTKWRRFVVLATAQSTADIASTTLRAAAEEKGVEIEIIQAVSPEMKECSYRGDREGMRAACTQLCSGLPECDGVFVAQASVAWLKEDIQKASGLPATTITEFMMKEIADCIHHPEGE